MKFQWIWLKNDTVEKDSYAEFIGSFSKATDESVILQIACDSVYNVEINGKLAAFGSCADYPHNKKYDEVDVTAFCNQENDLKITIWYFGDASSTYKIGVRGLGFSIKQGGQVLIESSEEMLSRKNIAYKNDYRKMISVQMGYSYFYDNTVENTLPYEKSAINGEVEASLRLKKNCVTKGRVPTSITKIDNGYRIDMGREVVGFLDLDLVSPKVQKLTIVFGEDLRNGELVEKIDTRQFSVEFVAKEGENKYCNAFRRLAGRYLDVICETELEIGYIGFNEVVYPLSRKEHKFEDSLIQKIYDTCVHTLVCCVHDHYEDCPWREQAQYVMDSRNQMLCGYYAFEETEFQKNALLLTADGLREDNLLDICFPSELCFTIPFFSLVFPMQVYEYGKYTNDRETVELLIPTARRILETFRDRIDETGLIPSFKGHWNFYEWSDGSDFQDELSGKIRSTHYDLILNCAYVYACAFFEKLAGEAIDNTALKAAIEKNFYVEEKGLYKLCLTGEEMFSKLGNSFAYLIGLGQHDGFIERMMADDLIEVSLSMRAFYYDALLKADKNYKGYILDDIKVHYKKMLDCGATTFWETELGWSDFGGAGSLCHGWSALPIYYFLMDKEA